MSSSQTTGDGVDVTSLVPYRSVVDDNWRWAGFRHRPDDIFICTPPKCGTTWMQTIVTGLIFANDRPGPVTELSLWIEMRRFPIDPVLDTLASQEHRRCIKSHTPADGIPWFDDCRYIVVGRDGRDAFMSLLNHMRNMRQDELVRMFESAIEEGFDLGEISPEGPPPWDDVHTFFDYWLQSGDYFTFVRTYWERREHDNILFVHFNDLKDDLDGQMRRVARFLEIEVDEQLWPSMVESCTFEAMKADSDKIGTFDLFEGGAETFLHKGTNDRWQNVLTEEELAAYDARATELLPADALAWSRGEHVTGMSD